jgi:hypothetical protein
MSMADKYFAMSKGMNVSIETTPKIASAEPEKIQAYRDM